MPAPLLNAPLPPTIKLLTEHLDTALAAGEDLAELSFDPAPACASGVTDECSAAGDTGRDLRAFVETTAHYEAACILRVLSARERAEDLEAEDNRFGQIIGLFRGGTNPLADLADRNTVQDWASATRIPCAIEYLRSRGLIGEEEAGPDPYQVLHVTDEFRVGRAVQLGALMDLTAAFLDAIEIHYEIFPTSLDGFAVLSHKTGATDGTDNRQSRRSMLTHAADA